MSANLEKKLDFWIKNNYNVLFIGKAGAGKTSMIKEAFTKAFGDKWKYFSASTMDPWVDFVGVPKEREDEKGPYLDLIRPKEFRDDSVEAIFFDEFNRCISGDTKIPLADGYSVAIKDLVDREYFYVYSFNQKTNKIVIAKGHSARITERNEKLLKITLDNGWSLKCTYDHPILTSKNQFKQAKDFKVGDSLMPLYRLWDSNSKQLSGYEWVYQPKKNGKWELTYHLADEYNIRNGIYLEKDGEHRHHIDFNKSNNSPDNIVRMLEIDHIRTHIANKDFISAAGKKTHTDHPDLYSRTIGTKESKEKALLNSINTRKTSKKYKSKRSEISKKMYTPDIREYRSGVTKNQWKSGQFSKIDRVAAMRKNHVMRSYNLLFKHNIDLNSLTEENYPQIKSEINASGRTFLSLTKALEWFGSFENFKNKLLEINNIKTNNNHKIASIEECEAEDVYDLTVEEFHNFAVEGGIFVHNSPKKVKNAVMELIQFKSINGRKFNNLKVVWAAVNPDDDEDQKYDVEPIDPAQLDRFHIKCAVPYEPYLPYFKNKFGADIAKAAISWWKDLDSKQKNSVSPRRLDYALDSYSNGGDLRDVLPSSTNISKLIMELSSGPISEKIKSIFDSKNKEEAEKFLINENNYTSSINKIISNKEYLRFFLPLVSDEKLLSLMSDNNVQKDILANISDYYAKLYPIIKNIQSSRIKKNFVKNLLKELTNHHKKLNPVNKTIATGAVNPTSPADIKIYYNPASSLYDFKNEILSWRVPSRNTAQRYKNYNSLETNICSDIGLIEIMDSLLMIADLIAASQANYSLKTKFNKLGQIINFLIQKSDELGVNGIEMLKKHIPSYNNSKLLSLKDFAYYDKL